MWEKLLQIWRARDLRKNILIVLGMLAIFRVAAHIPIPGVDVANLKDFFASNQILGLANILTGGAMSNFSIIALGLGPYITSSIIFQLLTMIVPQLAELAKEGSAGYQKINQYSRIATVPLALLQSYGMITLFSRSSQPIIGAMSLPQILTTMIVMTGGAMFLVWLGELITERKVGNGISLLIFAGIVAGLPGSAAQLAVTFTPASIVNLLVFAVLGVITVAAIVIITEGQRNIPVSYARRVRGIRMYGGMDTYLPLRVNQAGMIPIIFAISLVLFPSLIGQFLVRTGSSLMVSAGQFMIDIFQNQLLYGLIYFTLVVAFTYFYTSIIFHPHQISENLQKQGGFVPGIRPGQPTGDYLKKVSNRIMLAGALFLGIIAILPLVTQQAFNTSALVVGGAGLLIVVSVVIETMRQIEAQLTMREYEQL